MATNDSIVDGVAGRYAAALFDLAKEQGDVPAIEASLATFQALLDESEDLSRMVRSPVIATDDQLKAIEAILARAGIGGLAANFFKLITANRRLFVASDVIKAFRAIAAKDRGEVTAEVSSAFALNNSQTAELKAALKAAVGKDVTLNTRVDPGLLGGLVVKVGSRMIDSSLRTKLQTLRSVLRGPGA